MHEQLITERNDKYFSEKLKELQRRVNKNASMSRHYHDIWTYVNFWHPIGKWQVLHWMQGLVESRQYDRVNIVEFVHHEELSREAFARNKMQYPLDIFTYYAF